MRKFILGAVAVLSIGGTLALADTLHGFCGTPTVTSCPDNGTVSPTTANPPSFGFWGSPGASGQDFLLVLMAPNNAVTSSYSLSISGTNVTNSPVSSHSVSATPFTSGFLSAYLNLNESNDNKIDAFLPSTQSVDSGATGYFVFTFDFGKETGTGSGKADTPPYFTVSSAVPLGSVFLGYEINSSKISGVTANSGAVLEDGIPKTSVPEPADFALVGLGLIALGCARKRIFSRKS